MASSRLLEIAEKAVRYSRKQGADQAQVTAFLTDSALTRFANSRIHQNVATKTGGVTIKFVLNKRISSVRVGTLEEGEIREGALQALRIAKASTPIKEFKSLPKPQKWSPIRGTFDKKTAECTPKYRAQKVKEAIEKAHSKSRKVNVVAGYFSSGSTALAIANSLGVSASASITTANMKVTVMSKSGNSEGSGTAEKYARSVEDIEPSLLAEDASEKSVRSLNPVKLLPGEYEVVLSPMAVSTLMTYLSFGFSATAYQDGQSFVKYHLNEHVFDEKITIVDDARSSNTLYSVPFDGEGVPKKAMKLVSRGVVSERSLCYNSFTAGKENKKSTGHAGLPLGWYWAERPMPFNVILNAGDATLQEEIADTKHGIFVTTTHYVNPVEPAKVILTGLTRDGTFLIQNGEISKPIMNMRFTDSMLSAFKETPMIGKQLEMMRGTTVPSVKLKKIRFVGVSAY